MSAAIPIILGGAEFLKWLSNRSSTNEAAERQYEALDKAQGAIEGGKNKALELFKPYLENAGRDYAQMRGLVQSGFFQQPYPGSFQSQSYAPQGFGFNPSAGSASFASWQPQGAPAGFNARPLPTMPAFSGPPPSVPMTRPNATPMPQVGPTPEGMQRGIENVTSSTLGPTAPPLPNKNQVPNPYADAVTPPGGRLPTQPLTLEERLVLYRLGRGSGPFAPYGSSGGLLGRSL